MEFCLIADSSIVGILTLLWTILKVAGGLGFVIFVHELGHFLVAKACGVKCEKFYVGFDVPIKIGPLRLPRTIVKFQHGETEYGIGIIPLGGYVKMLGQDDNPANYQKEAERIRVAETDATDESVAAADGEQTSEEPAAEAPAAEEATVSAAEPAKVELDPRSFPAKPVWQRMAIISAGVLMNLVFAVIFAAIAYRIGVSYTPCVVGGVAMGSPAWEQGWQQGDKIIGIDDEVTSEHLRFDWDLVQDVAISGSGSKPKPLKITLRTSDGSKRTDEVTASTELKKDFGPVTIGVRPVASTVLADEMPVWKHRVAGRTKTAFQSGDRVVAVDKKPLQQDPETKEFWVHDLTRRLTTKIDQPVVLTVERSRQDAAQEKQRIDITVNPAPMVQVGLVMEMGPITAIKRGSLAEKWKIQKGDWLLKVNGEAVDDPLTLPQHFAALAGQPVKLEFQRDGRSILKEVDALGVEYYLPYMGLGAKTGLESIGIAYEVRPVVQRVLPESSADRAGMQAGDEVIHVQFSHSPTNPEERLLFEKYFEKGYRYAESLDLETTPLSWIDVHHGLQQALPGTKVVVKYRRGKEMKDATLEGEDSQVSFFPIRGLNFVGLERTCRSDSWLSATALGFRETKIQLTRVQVFLVKLFKGQISVKNLGGPVIIATIAGGEAAQGIPRLLIFLTFLSANLAILNFLPIPALDGGHMVFLIFEGISGRPVNERIQGVLTLGGVACLLALMVFVLGNDIYRLFL